MGLACSSMSFEKLDEGSIAPPRPAATWRWAVGALIVLLLGGVVAIVVYRSASRAGTVAAREREQRALAGLAQAEADARIPAADVAAQVRALERLLAAQREAAEVRPSELSVRMAAIERTEAELQRLRSEADRVRSEELERRAAELTAAAVAATAAGNWDEALARFREARDGQERLNREFPRSRFSDLTALARIDAEIAALTADGLEAQVREHWDEARRFAAAGRAEEAIRGYERAAEAQRKLNARFARSRFVSMERLEEIEGDLQTLRAAPVLERIAALEGEARAHLRRRQAFQAQTVVQEALALDEQVRTQFPRARGANESLRLSLAFLGQRSPELAALQDRVYESIAPLPGRAAVAMRRGAVTQADFVRVMATNPSRTAGQAQPVESVTQLEAEEFCRRLAWLLGWRVRLPEAGELEAARADAATFAVPDSGRTEWLAGGGAGGAVAPVWADGRVNLEPRTARAVDRGFRFVVEVDLTAPP